MDLDHASDWGDTPIVACGLTSAELIALLTGGGTDPIVLDYTSCARRTRTSRCPLATTTLNKDAAFILPPSKVANISIDGNLTW